MVDLFPEAPRRKRRVLMHVCDAGGGCVGDEMVRFQCTRCGHETGWRSMSISESKRGIPCEAGCNK